MLSFAPSEEQSVMKETLARLVKGNLADTAHQIDESGDIPGELFQKVWELGLCTSAIPEEYGGYGLERSAVMNSIVLEELAAGDMAFAAATLAPSLFILPVLEAGTGEQKKKYLPPCCSDSFRPGSLAICEPRFGFDPAALRTSAEKKNGSYIINGKKCFVPFAAESEHLLVAASAGGENTLFIVARDNPGLRIGEREKNLGLYSLRTYGIELDNCEVPENDRLGDGACYARLLQKTRVALSAIGTGVSRASFEYARDYAKERVQFGEPIASRQSIAFMIAEMAYEVDAMRLLTWKAASALDGGRDASRESYLAKLYAGDMTMKITDYGVQILGGHGYVREHPVERYYRNGRGIAILEGMAIA